MKFILTRHTITDWNLSGRIQGQIDIPLNPQGKAGAKELAKLLSGLGINLIVSSDLKRASETAEIVNALLVVPLQLDPRLRECSFGNLEGLIKQQAIKKYMPLLASCWKDQYNAYDFRPCGGEHRDGVLARHIEVLKTFTNEKSDSTILLVGHGCGMCTLLDGLGYPPDLKQGEYKTIEYS